MEYFIPVSVAGIFRIGDVVHAGLPVKLAARDRALLGDVKVFVRIQRLGPYASALRRIIGTSIWICSRSGVRAEFIFPTFRIRIAGH